VAFIDCARRRVTIADSEPVQKIAAGIADHVWRPEAIVWRLDRAEAETRGTAEGERP